VRSDLLPNPRTSRQPLGLAALRAAVEPLGGAEGRWLPPPLALADLLPEGLRRGWVVQIEGGWRGGTSLALALAAAAGAQGSWSAWVGLPTLCPLAAAEAGVPLERCLLVPQPGAAWAEAVALALEGVDLVVARPPKRVSATTARRLHGQARHHGSVLLLLDGPSWPEPLDVVLEVRSASWHGVEEGHGHLQARRCQVLRTGRRSGGVPRTAAVWLPGPR
jgi:hypothetical protein